jgi:hypothetical protein
VHICTSWCVYLHGPGLHGCAQGPYHCVLLCVPYDTVIVTFKDWGFSPQYALCYIPTLPQSKWTLPSHVPRMRSNEKNRASCPALGNCHRAIGQNVQSHCAYRHCHLCADAHFRQSQYSYDLAESIIEPLTNRLDVMCCGKQGR